MEGGLYSSLNSGMLGLEMSIHQNPQNSQNPQNPQNPNSMHHPQMVAYPQPNGKSASMPYNNPNSSKSKQQLSLNSDEDEAGFAADGDPRRKGSPWQRMKWTDTMVRLLIMAVFYIGDEGVPEPSVSDPKKKTGALLQKKGKWKSVSRAMMEKGFYVSPQQCEDKFNDLNKRYKRVNDILGKGTACRVVENQALLETMDLAPKLKEEAKKLLNSKHLFFREMCAYHTSCGHGHTHGGAHSSPEMATASAAAASTEPPHQQQRCFHSEVEAGAKTTAKGGSSDDDDDDDDEDEDDEDDDDEDDGEEVVGGGGPESHGKKRQRKCYSLSSAVLQELSREVGEVVRDSGKSPWEKKQWMKMKLLNLEEQQVSYQGQAYELERQRLKWVKFSSKKEREMERAKLENERRRLENERMLLLVRQKELEFMDLHHHHHKRSDPSSVTG